MIPGWALAHRAMSPSSETGMMMGRADGARQQRISRMSVRAEDFASVGLALTVKPHDARPHRSAGLRRDRCFGPLMSGRVHRRG